MQGNIRPLSSNHDVILLQRGNANLNSQSRERRKAQTEKRRKEGRRYQRFDGISSRAADDLAKSRNNQRETYWRVPNTMKELFTDAVVRITTRNERRSKHYWRMPSMSVRYLDAVQRINDWTKLLGYPTQKPERLLDRIIESSSTKATWSQTFSAAQAPLLQLPKS